MQMKKVRFRRARELRRLGLPFALARKVANDLVRHGMLMRHDLPGLRVLCVSDWCGCCSSSVVVVDSHKGPLEFFGLSDSDFRWNLRVPNGTLFSFKFLDISENHGTIRTCQRRRPSPQKQPVSPTP